MGEPRKPDDGSGPYWKVRIGLEVLKTGIWMVFQWIRPGGPGGLL